MKNLKKKLLQYVKSLQPEQTFTVRFYCKNCGNESTYALPARTRIVRAPYLGYPQAKTTAYIPKRGEVILLCTHCKIGNVA